MVPLISFFCDKNQPSGMHAILAERFLRNSGYLVECEICRLLSVGFHTKEVFEKSKNTEVCLNLTLKWQR